MDVNILWPNVLFTNIYLIRSREAAPRRFKLHFWLRQIINIFFYLFFTPKIKIRPDVKTRLLRSSRDIRAESKHLQQGCQTYFHRGPQQHHGRPLKGPETL